jgi:hypothetical protein
MTSFTAKGAEAAKEIKNLEVRRIKKPQITQISQRQGL